MEHICNPGTGELEEDQKTTASLGCPSPQIDRPVMFAPSKSRTVQYLRTQKTEKDSNVQRLAD